MTLAPDFNFLVSEVANRSSNQCKISNLDVAVVCKDGIAPVSECFIRFSILFNITSSIVF